MICIQSCENVQTEYQVLTSTQDLFLIEIVYNQAQTICKQTNSTHTNNRASIKYVSCIICVQQNTKSYIPCSVKCEDVLSSKYIHSELIITYVNHYK